MATVDFDAQFAKYKKLAMWVLVPLAIAASAPLAFYVVEGLLGWLMAALLAGAILNFAPAVSVWFANKRIAALKAVIEANPIETMHNLYIDKQQELDRAEANITDFDTELQNFRDKVLTFKTKYPDKAPAYVAIQARMEECLDGMRAEHAQATTELHQFADKITEAEALFDMAKAANKMLAKSQSAQQAVYAQIKEQVSFDKVRSDLNRAFANLNTAIERRKNAAFSQPSSPKALPEASTPDLPVVTDITDKVPVTLPRRHIGELKR